MKVNNKGFSYIEMILVVSITAVMVGMVTITMSVVNRNNVSKGANKLENGLAKAQVMCMAHGSVNGAMTLMCENGKYYYYFGNDYDNRVLFCQSPCTVTLTSIDGAVTSDLATTSCVLSFKNTTGGLNTSVSSSLPIIYSKITIENRNKYRADLNIDKITGNVRYEFISY